MLQLSPLGPFRRTDLLNLSAWIALTASLAAARLPARPNIVFIMTDDHAAHAISAYGSRINQTPQLDRLGAEGIRFNRCFVGNSICTPSRATILTGKYSHKNGVPTFNPFNGAQPHIAKYLQQAGYHTGIVGKWHLGTEPTGFDFYSVLPGQGAYHNPAFLERGGRRTVPGYATDIITDMAMDFVRQRPAEKPFFLCLHHKAPHRNWVPDAQHAAMFDGIDIPEPPTLRDDYSTRTDAAREASMTVTRHLTRNDLKLIPSPDLSPAERNRWLGVIPTEVTTIVDGKEVTLKDDALFRWKYQRYIKDYLRCIASVDDNVGRFIDFLDASGLRENTLVVYTSDQGFFLGDHGWYDKRFMYEECLRTPLLMRWPGVIKPGQVTEAMTQNLDFAPTFMELAGLRVPADMQGRSLAPWLRGESPRNWRTAVYYRYYHDPGHHNTRAHYGIRTDTHKLIHFWKRDQWECYDLRQDPKELHNLANDPAHARTVARLKRQLFRLKREVQDHDEFSKTLPNDNVDAPNFVQAVPAE